MLRDGPVSGATVLVQGVLGGVGSLAAQLARWGGATVIGTVRRTADLDRVDRAVAHAVALDAPDAVDRIRVHAPDGVARVVEVSLSDNADRDVQVTAVGGVIAAYASRLDRPELPYWPLLLANVTLRLLGSAAFPPAAKHQAAADLTAAAADGALAVPIADPLPPDRIATAHDRVDAGGHHRVLLALP